MGHLRAIDGGREDAEHYADIEAILDVAAVPAIEGIREAVANRNIEHAVSFAHDLRLAAEAIEGLLPAEPPAGS
jgi:hypothetical protein